MVSIFTSRSSLEDFVMSESPWFQMICKLNRVFIDEDPYQDIDDDIDPEEDVYQILDTMGVTVDTDHCDYINNIPKDPSSVLKYPCGIFLLDISEAKAHKIQEDYGVICQSTNKLDFSPLVQPNYPNELEENETGKSWKSMISRFRELPSNSALIIDAHLFQQDRYDEGAGCYDANNSKGITNLQEILDAILPEYFCGIYHVGVLLTDYDIANKNIAQKNLTNKRIANAINKLKSRLDRPFDISIEVVFVDKNDNGAHTLIHNRRIISNYYIVTADYALAAIHNGRSLRSQSITAYSLFENIQIDSESDKKEKRMRSDLRKLKSLLEQQTRAIQPSLSFYQNGQLKTDLLGINHRMLTFS